MRLYLNFHCFDGVFSLFESKFDSKAAYLLNNQNTFKNSLQLLLESYRFLSFVCQLLIGNASISS